MGEAGNWPGSIKTVAEWFPAQQRAFGLSIVNTGAALGPVVAPPLVVWLQISYGWKTAFLVTGKAIAVPLFNLVYHDAILTPYRPNDLHGLLNGGLPQTSGAGELNKEDLVQINRMCALNRRVALLEMSGHESLDKNYRKERTTFADGTTVTVDWDAGKVEIQMELNQR